MLGQNADARLFNLKKDSYRPQPPASQSLALDPAGCRQEISEDTVSLLSVDRLLGPLFPKWGCVTAVCSTAFTLGLGIRDHGHWVIYSGGG